MTGWPKPSSSMGSRQSSATPRSTMPGNIVVPASACPTEIREILAFNLNLKRMRAALGLSQEELAT